MSSTDTRARTLQRADAMDALARHLRAEGDHQQAAEYETTAAEMREGTTAPSDDFFVGVGGTCHNLSDSKCRVRGVNPTRPEAACKPCRRALARIRCAICHDQAVVDVIPSAVEQERKGTRPHSLCQKHYDVSAPLLHRAGQVVAL